MSQDIAVINGESHDRDVAQVVHALMRFAAAVRYRKNTLLAVLLTGGLLGGLYYLTATRYFAATAELLIIRTAPTMLSTSIGDGGVQQSNQMPTFEDLCTSDKVVEGALKYLRPEDRIDLAGVPKASWVRVIQGNLVARAKPKKNIIAITYRSKDAKAAVSVVNAVVGSYIEFLDKTHKGTLGEIRRILTEEKVELAKKLVQKELALADARHSFGDIGLRSGSKILSPAVQAVVSFNESLIRAQEKRAELEASRAAVMAAVRNGENLQQHVMALADVVGKEMLLGSLGFTTRDSHMLADMERRLIEDRALLRTMLDDLGPLHPEVISKTNGIRMTEQYLAGHQGRVKDRIAQIQNDQLGPLLVQMVQQKLDEAVQLEVSLRATLKDARTRAVALNGQLAKLESLEHDRQWLLNLRDALADRIANIELAHDGQEIRTALIGEPKVRRAPVHPNLSYVGLITMALSLASGLALVYVLDILDDRFRSVEELQGQLGLPVLAMVREMNTTDCTGPAALQVCTAPTSAESEAFRTLRTALELADGEARRIVISSAQSGDGKTTVLANLAASYAQAGKKALLIDGDLRRPGMTTMMGMRGMDGLSGVIRGKGDLVEAAKAAIRDSGVKGMDILSSGPRSANPAELLANPRFSELLSWAETVYEQIFIDSPPLLATSDAAVIGRLVDGVILVVQPDKNRRRLVMRTIETLTSLGVPLLGLIVNRVGSHGDPGYYGYGQGYGYGYGYGYEGSDEYHNEEPTATKQTDQQTGEKDDPPDGTISRRVA